jgi:hypothetical protein
VSSHSVFSALSYCLYPFCSVRRELSRAVLSLPQGHQSEYANALSILADYFGEEPTKEQLDTRQCKCWKLHLAFANEESMGKSLISSDDITEWIEYKTKQFSEEDYIILMLKNPSLPILITKSNNDLDQYVWSYLDGKGIENSFAEA